MIIECPNCGTKNQTTQPPQLGKRYRCGKCGAVITYLQTTDTLTKIPKEDTAPRKQDTLAEVPKEKPQLERRQEAKKEKGSKPRKGFLIILVAIVVIAIILLLYFQGYIG